MAKILIVDDSTTVREQLRRDLLANQFEVLEAADGLEALKATQTQPIIDLIICDVNMPNMDGLTFCERYFELKGAACAPIFMLTTEVVGDMKDRAKKIGIKAWITKPYVPAKLIHAITVVLSKKREP